MLGTQVALEAMKKTKTLEVNFLQDSEIWQSICEIVIILIFFSTYLPNLRSHIQSLLYKLTYL